MRQQNDSSLAELAKSLSFLLDAARAIAPTMHDWIKISRGKMKEAGVESIAFTLSGRV